MLNWFARNNKKRITTDIRGNTHCLSEHWLAPEQAETLIDTPLRKKLLQIIWQRTSLPHRLFTELYQRPIFRFALLAQNLPASESHHHAYPGGLLDHTLETMAFAAKMRQSHLLPAGAAPEDQAREAEAWTAAVIYGALLHDIGKTATDIEVMTYDNQRWYPWEGALTKSWHLKYRRSRDYHLHPVIGSLLCMKILPASALSWLAQYPELFGSFMYCISGHYDKAGVLGELVQNADRASVAQNMGGDATQALSRPQPTLAKQIIIALRELAQNQFTLNNAQSGSDGWLTDEALWLISKTAADKIRAWLLQNGVTGIPDNNSRLFDEMQSYGVIVPSPGGKGIWNCNVIASSGWTPGCNLTLLRIAPSLIWPDTGNRPAAFSGTVTPAEAATEKQEQPETRPGNTLPPVAEKASTGDDLTDIAFSLFASPEKLTPPVNTAEINKHDENNTGFSETIISAHSHVADSCSGVQDEPQLPSDTDFIHWLRKGLQENKIVFNDTLARVHMVEGKAFLVSPEIFKLYVKSTTGQTGDEWKHVQKSFQKLKLHRRGNEGVNIWTIEVRGPRKTRRVKGYLVDNPAEIFGQSIPEDNPYLSVITQ
ncbi:relaxase [Salmonella enterica subsp. enterica]|nr:relaxase [Salmonella enterica subsp. enterica]MIF51133.1 relaxase [Salmonella enterica subsp. enterica]